MIVKMSDADRGTDPLNVAGLAAERTMAFYLRRAFKDDPAVFVFNDLRLEHEGEVAQIDHLVVHHGGMVIVESKSVSGEVLVNEHGEWARRTGSRHEGMPSPVLQARRQEAVLRAMLRGNSERLRNRVLMGILQAQFNRYWPIDIFVAISDKGRIARKADVPELRKADQVPDEIAKLVSRHRRGRWSPNPLNSDGDSWLSPVEMGRLIQFLLAGHSPKAAGISPGGRSVAAAAQSASPRDVTAPAGCAPAPSAAAESSRVASFATRVAATTVAATSAAANTEPEPCCRHCGSAAVYMRYARTTRPYYFRCLQCGGSTPAVWECGGCGARARIRKRGPDYFRVCEACGTTAHVFRNPADAPST